MCGRGIYLYGGGGGFLLVDYEDDDWEACLYHAVGQMRRRGRSRRTRIGVSGTQVRDVLSCPAHYTEDDDDKRHNFTPTPHPPSLRISLSV